MSKTRRKKVKTNVDETRWYFNPDIYVYYELPFGKKDVIVPGTILKLKNTRGTFKYIRTAHNAKLDRTWVDLIGVQTFAYRSVYIGKIRNIVKPKRSRRKKTDA